MTDIPAATSATTTATTGSVAGRIAASRARLATNYETFLGLLTTQLRNQDPLSPMDSNQFTQQIVQMTGVEQQLLTNDLLTALVDQGAGTVADAANYIGRTITADGGTAELADGEAEWTYVLGEGVAAATAEIRDDRGVVVWRGQLTDKAEGEHAFAWDGRNLAGNQMPDGNYTLSISATDRNGEAVSARTLMRGRVTGVENRDGVVFLITDKGDVPLTSVRGVVETATGAPVVPSSSSVLSAALAALGA